MQGHNQASGQFGPQSGQWSGGHPSGMWNQQQQQQQQSQSSSFSPQNQQQPPQWQQQRPQNQWGPGPQQNQWGQQQGQWGPQQGQWGQQQQPYPCCPEDPNEHCCNTDPNQPMGQSTFLCLWQQCDATTWLVVVFALLTTIGFAVTVADKGTDNLMGKYSASDDAELYQKMYYHDLNHVAQMIDDTNGTNPPQPTPPTTTEAPVTVIINGSTFIVPRQTTTTHPPSTTTGTATATATARAGTHLRRLLQVTNFTRSPVPYRRCNDKQKLFGAFGPICAEETLSSTAMLMNQSRWIIFRGTLYFLAMLVTWTLLVLIVLVNRHKVWVDAGMPFGGFQGQAPAYNFFATPMYYTFRAAWGAVSFFVFFWIVTEMYQYWWFIDYYKSQTSDDLQSFWKKFDAKFVPSVICVAIYLCWPIAHLLLQLAFFILGFIPWMIIKSMYMQLANTPYDEEKPYDEQSCCMRTNAFYSDFRQLSRLGFSEGQWNLITGTRIAYCQLDCMGQQGPPGQQPGMNSSFQQNQMQPPRPGAAMSGAGGPSSGGFGGSSFHNAQPNVRESMMTVNRSGSFVAPSQGTDEETPRKRDKRSKKDKTDKTDKKEKSSKDKSDKDKSEKKDKKRRSSSVGRSMTHDDD